MAATSKPPAQLTLPIALYTNRLANLAHNCNGKAPGLLLSLSKAIDAFNTLMETNPCSFHENAELQFRRYPIQLDYSQDISSHDIAYWQEYISLVDNDKVLPRMEINGVKIPSIMLHPHTPAKRDTPNQIALTETVKKLQMFARHIEHQNEDYKMVDCKSIERDYINDLIAEFAIVLDHRKISKDYVETIYASVLESAEGKRRESVIANKERLINGFKSYIERICNFCVFKICKNIYTDCFDMPRVCYVDGTSLLTSNPLLMVFFLLAFGIRSFNTTGNQNEHWVFYSISTCIEKMKQDEKKKSITDYFQFVRSPAMKTIPERFVMPNYKLPVNPTYTTLNRCNEVVNYKTLWDLKVKKCNNNQEKLLALRAEMNGSWYMTVFLKNINGTDAMTIHPNFMTVLKGECGDLKDQFIIKPSNKTGSIIAFNWQNIIDVVSKPVVISLPDDSESVPVNKGKKKKPSSTLSDDVLDDDTPSPTIINAEPKEKTVKPPPKPPRPPTPDLIDDIIAPIQVTTPPQIPTPKTNDNGPTKQQFSIPQAFMDNLLAQFRVIVREEIANTVREQMDKAKADIIESIGEQLVAMQVKQAHNIINEIGGFGVNVTPKPVRSTFKRERTVFDEEDEELLPIDNFCDDDDVCEITPFKAVETTKQDDSDDDSDSTDEDDVNVEIEELYTKYLCQKATISSDLIHSRHPLNLCETQVMFVSNYDVYMATQPPAAQKEIGFEDDLTADEVKYIFMDYVRDITSCHMYAKCATDEPNEHVSPIGPIGYCINVDYEHMEAFLDPNQPYLLKRNNYNLDALDALLSLREAIAKHPRNRVAAMKVINDYAHEHDVISKTIEVFNVDHESFICDECYTRDDIFLERQRVFESTNAKHKVKKAADDDTAYLDIYNDIKANAPPPFDEDEFDTKKETCFNCNGGFHWKDRRGRKPYVLITDQFDKLKPKTLAIHYKDPPIFKFPVLLKIKLIDDAPNGVIFCSKECEKEFDKETKKLKKLIANETKAKERVKNKK